MGNHKTKQITPTSRYDYNKVDNWIKPDKLTFIFYELSICSSIDFRSRNHRQIREIWIFEFDIGINREKVLGKNYNIILNANKQGRYKNQTNPLAINHKPCKKLKTFVLRDEIKINEIFESIKTYVKSQNLDNQVDSLFNLMDD
jgi:hypothetical protein